MDSSSHQHQEASSSTSEHHLPQTEVRSSARVKAAKQKAKDKADDSEQSSSALPQARSKSKRAAKSKARESSDITTATATRPVKRYAASLLCLLRTHACLYSARRNPPPAQPPLTINEPVRDPKGKKRAAPEPNSDEEESAGPSTKRPRTTSYSLRSTTVKDSIDMPRKTR
jgi:E3 ubiquitin-protein ligase TRIP12